MQSEPKQAGGEAFKAVLNFRVADPLGFEGREFVFLLVCAKSYGL
jgi:hypothetical protein